MNLGIAIESEFGIDRREGKPFEKIGYLKTPGNIVIGRGRAPELMFRGEAGGQISAPEGYIGTRENMEDYATVILDSENKLYVRNNAKEVLGVSLGLHQIEVYQRELLLINPLYNDHLALIDEGLLRRVALKEWKEMKRKEGHTQLLGTNSLERLLFEYEHI